jgi:hypothetical protein
VLTFAPNARICLHARPTDMRKSFDGLCALVRGVFQADPLEWQPVSVRQPPGRSHQGAWLEHATFGSVDRGESSSSSGKTKVSASASHGLPTDPDLAAIVDAWPALPAALKAGIVAMIRAAGDAKA